MKKFRFLIPILLLCACSYEKSELINTEDQTVEVVEVIDEDQPLLDVYDSIQDRWICYHEGTTAEICEIHDIDTADTHLWIFKNIIIYDKKENYYKKKQLVVR